MRALGYSKSIKPFEELACRVPLNFMESIKPKESLGLRQAWLVGTAGLLPSQRSQGEFSRDAELRELKRVWRTVSKGATPMRENDWNLWHIYPNNSPIRRIVAQSYLLERYYDTGLLGGDVTASKGNPTLPSPLNEEGQRERQASLAGRQLDCFRTAIGKTILILISGRKQEYQLFWGKVRHLKLWSM